MENKPSQELKLGISVVIPNFNGRDLLEKNIPPVLESLNKAAVDYEIIVSDDASTDDSVLFLKKTFPQIKVITTDKNQGFSPTINNGIRQASKKLILALNSDVALTPDYFLPQFKYFERDDTFGVMGRIIGLEDDTLQDAAKYPDPTFWGKIKSTTNYLPRRLPAKEWLPSFFLSGANALMDREKVQLLGGFSELFAPFYGEDVDLSLRAWRLGWKCYYEHYAVCRHPASATIKKYNVPKKIKLVMERNKLIFHDLHLDGIMRLKWNIYVVLRLILYSLSFRFVYWQALKMYLKSRNSIHLDVMNFNKVSSTRKCSSTSEVIKQLKHKISCLNGEII